METKEITRVGSPGVLEEAVKVPAAARGIDPLLQSALSSVAVVINGSSKAGDDEETGMAIAGVISVTGPEAADGILERSTRVVSDDVVDAVLHPSTDNVTVVKTSDGRGNKAVGREVSSVSHTHLREPGLVENDLLAGVGVGGVVELLVGEGVGKVAKGVTVGRLGEPLGERIKHDAVQSPVVGNPLGIP